MSKEIFSKKRNSNKNNFFKIFLGVLAIIILLWGGIKVVTMIGSNLANKASINKEQEEQEKVIKPNPDDVVPGMNITYEADKYAVDAKDVQAMANDTYKGEGKYVFLTFDDGPSNSTEKILNILKDKDVHGTFFVLGSSIEKDSKRQEYLKEELKSGNAIANHSYSHDFKKLYPGNKLKIDSFMDEFNKTNDIMQSILGGEFDCKVLRMPGGYGTRKYYKDPSLKEFDDTLQENGIINVDWNALDGDAEGKPYSTEEMLNYVKKTSKGKNHVVILMHDAAGKEKTVEILPQIIDYYKNEGYDFKVIKNTSKEENNSNQSENNKDKSSK
ncbi:polysaccharide deacetylase family protein [Clostridium perfringens]|uniref:polysaccharide deacetylase family protein n=1 Tax=Clostridium perfringens TaxID=1502 RepID=UPI00115A55E2|nr:polysaccharide deacetylase family protein [Clostridium perfringens]MDK0909150.1 polysaccharide deacetylase [Clostridium perfringens]MDM0663921.1 polysaccharide deacetylase family protein [Clostridium perfringens]MDM0963335.1 polysaccharide deacetylase family protein [Clostridium perfringens]MDM1001996.1 polysaccharide deacetylase family protein [Clostridium perfringens]MDU2325653.1 polysaccharide deacetylase family protein [Clostridium perfringens]